MPRVVDHEARRHELAAAAWRAIVKYGLEGTTTRLIARESGYSAGVLAHYFESKDEILLEALRISHEGVDKRIREAVDDKHGFDALRTFCIEVLPVAEQPVRETHLEMSMWSRALVNDELRSVQRSESSRWRRLLEGLIVDAREDEADRQVEVYGIGSTDKAMDMIRKNGITVFEEGVITGVAGVLLNEGRKRDFDVITLLSEAHPDYPDARAAARAIEVIDKLLSRTELDARPLYEEAERIEMQLKNIHHQTDIAKKPSEPARPSMYG